VTELFEMIDMMPQPKGKPIRFETLKRGKSLIKLSDGNYLEVELVVNKILKSDQLNPSGEPIYGVQHGVVITFWRPEEIAKLEEEK